MSDRKILTLQDGGAQPQEHHLKATLKAVSSIGGVPPTQEEREAYATASINELFDKISEVFTNFCEEEELKNEGKKVESITLGLGASERLNRGGVPLFGYLTLTTSSIAIQRLQSSLPGVVQNAINFSPVITETPIAEAPVEGSTQ